MHVGKGNWGQKCMWESKGKNALGKLGSKSKNVWEIREGSKKDKNQEGRREIRKRNPLSE